MFNFAWDCLHFFHCVIHVFMYFKLWFPSVSVYCLKWYFLKPQPGLRLCNALFPVTWHTLTTLSFEYIHWIETKVLQTLHVTLMLPFLVYSLCCWFITAFQCNSCTFLWSSPAFTWTELCGSMVRAHLCTPCAFWMANFAHTVYAWMLLNGDFFDAELIMVWVVSWNVNCLFLASVPLPAYLLFLHPALGN